MAKASKTSFESFIYLELCSERFKDVSIGLKKDQKSKDKEEVNKERKKERKKERTMERNMDRKRKKMKEE